MGKSLNFPAWHKWMWVRLLSTITLLTPFTSSILPPAVSRLDEEFGNNNVIVGSMTVNIYLTLGYVVGLVFIPPLSKTYGRKPVLSAANTFFCLWQIGCVLASNIETLVIAGFFSSVGGAGCLPTRLWEVVSSAIYLGLITVVSRWEFGILDRSMASGLFSLYIAFVFGVVYPPYTTNQTVFEETYGFDAKFTRLVYLFLGLGNVLGWLVYTFFSDETVARLAQANGDVLKPGMRLTISISFGVCLPITLF
ncbi:major facilitator superfamily domain-containing protein [Hypoxylon sp. NC0597]|nr:major facilitator superfamily domain-containing protein [Hypoxylon sp. NC0597]